ncbi:hypothetical protein NXF25_005935 [Crotalus adamanteus]|uniref:Uncharacterized protein n=1 Tax=Crotalus adamanteus TaxID=8729 RepID=A0AAW1BXN9_CROAD
MLKYVPGGKNFLVDALSRMPQYRSKREEVIQALILHTRQEMATSIHQKSKADELDAVRAAMRTDKWAQEHSGWLTKRDGIGWKGERMYVPETLQKVVLQRGHDAK